MVNVALDESDGILEYETSLAKQQTWVKFKTGEIDEKILMENIKKRTGYNNLYVQNKN